MRDGLTNDARCLHKFNVNCGQANISFLTNNVQSFPMLCARRRMQLSENNAYQSTSKFALSES